MEKYIVVTKNYEYEDEVIIATKKEIDTLISNGSLKNGETVYLISKVYTLKFSGQLVENHPKVAKKKVAKK